MHHLRALSKCHSDNSHPHDPININEEYIICLSGRYSDYIHSLCSYSRRLDKWTEEKRLSQIDCDISLSFSWNHCAELSNLAFDVNSNTLYFACDEYITAIHMTTHSVKRYRFPQIRNKAHSMLCLDGKLHFLYKPLPADEIVHFLADPASSSTRRTEPIINSADVFGITAYFPISLPNSENRILLLLDILSSPSQYL